MATTTTVRDLDVRRARKLFEREHAKETALRNVLSYKETDPSVISSLQIKTPNRFPLSREAHSSQTRSRSTPLALNRSTEADRNAFLMSPVPTEVFRFKEDLRRSQAAFRDALTEQIRDRNMRLAKEIEYDKEYCVYKKMEADYLDELDKEIRRAKVMKSRQEAEDIQKQAREKHDRFVGEGMYHVILDTHVNGVTKEEILESKKQNLQKKTELRKFISDDMRRRQDDLNTMKEKTIADAEKLKKASEEMSILLSKREEDRKEMRKKALESQNHHVSIYQKIVDEEKLRMKEDETRILRDHEFLEQKSEEREHLDKRKKKEKATIVQDFLTRQIEEKKRTQETERRKLIEEFEEQKKKSDDALRREEDEMRRKLEFNKSYQSELIGQMSKHRIDLNIPPRISHS